MICKSDLLRFAPEGPKAECLFRQLRACGGGSKIGSQQGPSFVMCGFPKQILGCDHRTVDCIEHLGNLVEQRLVFPLRERRHHLAQLLAQSFVNGVRNTCPLGHQAVRHRIQDCGVPLFEASTP